MGRGHTRAPVVKPLSDELTAPRGAAHSQVVDLLAVGHSRGSAH